MYSIGVENVVSWYMTNINYLTVFLLMAIESTFIPFPSEIVIPPAAFKAISGDLNIFLVVISGTLGTLAGALFNYYIAYILGRKIIYRLSETRLAHIFLIDSRSIQKAEKFFNSHGKSSTLIGRLVPAIRQLISIPAGLSRMNMKDFIFYTVLGSLLWNIILAALGYFFYGQRDLLAKNYHLISLLGLITGILFIIFLIYKAIRKKTTSTICINANIKNDSC